MSAYLEIVLMSLQAHVERMAAELHNPTTSSARLAAIRQELIDLRAALVKLLEATG